MTRNNYISRGTLDSPLAWVELDADAPAKARKTWKCGPTLSLMSRVIFRGISVMGMRYRARA